MSHNPMCAWAEHSVALPFQVDNGLILGARLRVNDVPSLAGEFITDSRDIPRRERHRGLQNRTGQFRQHREHYGCRVAAPSCALTMNGATEATAHLPQATLDILFRTLVDP